MVVFYNSYFASISIVNSFKEDSSKEVLMSKAVSLFFFDVCSCKNFLYISFFNLFILAAGAELIILRVQVVGSLIHFINLE